MRQFGVLMSSDLEHYTSQALMRPDVPSSSWGRAPDAKSCARPELGSSSCLPCLIIRLVIQTIRRDPSRSVWTDEAPNVSRPDRSGADQIDAEHQATDLAVGGSNLSRRAQPSARWRGHVCSCSSGSPGWIAVASDPSSELSGAVSRLVARRSQGSTVTALATLTSSSLSHNGRCA